MKARDWSAALSVVAVSFVLGSAQARDLTFEQRVEAQEAIERVYYSHQIGATKPFQEAVPRDVLESKVATYLRQSAALGKYWKTSMTAEMLSRELERQAQGSRMTSRLRELYAALGNDSFLVAECLARPALVDRLSRNFFAYDETIHGTQKREAEALRAELERKDLSAYAHDPGRSEVEIVATSAGEALEAGGNTGQQERRRKVSAEDFARLRARAPRRVGEIGPVLEDRDSFTIPVVLDQGPSSMRLAIFTVPKRTWDDWWIEVSPTLDARSVSAVQPSVESLPSLRVASEASCLPDDTWGESSLTPLPEGRHLHTAVWTGTWMIVWGGQINTWPPVPIKTGGKYDPATDTWSSVSVAGSPGPRYQHSAVWTGTEMIVWGGWDGINIFFPYGGGRYDPLTNTWKPVTQDGAPSSRFAQSAVWTGTRMIVWGGASGEYTDTGGQYDPASDTWTATSTAGAPYGRHQHTAVWTGTEMIVWGGFGVSNLNTGGRYDPATDTWLPVSTDRAPSWRFQHTAVWTGAEMIVWGGFDYVQLRSDGGRYDPATDLWKRITAADAPSPRSKHGAVWTGSRMVIWGADKGSTGGSYDPVANRWTTTSTVGAPKGLSGPTAVWTGTAMIVWGGDDSNDVSDDSTGGRYDPVSDSWTPTSTEGRTKERSNHTAVWTGAHMIIWGGRGYVDVVRDGGRYDPVLDTWTPTAQIHAPGPARENHSAVWTGSEMIVWGGCIEYYDDCDAGLRNGGRYDPIADTWKSTLVTGAPSSRWGHAAVWTGSRMIIWGHRTSSGASYDPERNRWTAISAVDAPPSYDVKAVWTGSRMLAVGSNYGTTSLSAGQYDPQTDAWTPGSTIDAPSPRTNFSVVWTGRELILWGGYRFPSSLGSGARYDPASDTWTPTQTLGAATPRSDHTAVWTGARMVVWGGDPGDFPQSVNSGARYDPATDSWTQVSESNAPSARSRHTAVWTGSEMIVWGGVDGSPYESPADGGRYAVSDCAGD